MRRQAARLRGELLCLLAAIHRFRADQGFLLASGLAFAFVLCLAPLLLILLSVAGFLLESAEIARYLYDSVTLLFPAYGREFAELLGLLTAERTVTGALGAAGLAVFATQLFSLMRAVVNQAFRVRPRGFLHGFAFDLVAVIVVGSLMMTLAVASLLLVTLGDLAVRVLPLPAALGLRRALTIPLMYAMGAALLFFTYRTFPNTAVPARAAAIATAVVMGLWEAARWLFAAYVSLTGVYGRLYGSFGIAVGVLVWIYYSTIIFVLGAELAAVLTERTVLGRAEPAPEPAPLGEEETGSAAPPA